VVLVIGIPRVDVGEESRTMEIDNNTPLCEYIPDDIHKMFGDPDLPQHQLLESLWLTCNELAVGASVNVAAISFIAQETGLEDALTEHMHKNVFTHPSMQEPEPEPSSPPKLHIVGDVKDD